MFGKSKKKRDRSRSPMNRKNNNKMQRGGGNLPPRRFFNAQAQRDSPILQSPLNVKTNNLLNLPQQQPSPSLLGPALMDQSKFSSYNNNLNNNPQQNLMQANQVNQMNQMNQLNQINQMNQMSQINQINNPEFNKPPVGSLGSNSQTLANPNQAPLGNELEIIVMSKNQWQYCEMLERRFRAETCLRFIDLVFPHTPEMVAITLKDLYEKKTLYAVVVDALNEANNTFNLHVLHNQTEYSNVSINQGIQLICQDFIKEIANPDSSYYRQKPQSTPQTTSTILNSINNAPKKQDNYSSPYKSVSSSSHQMNEVHKLPSNIAYVLKTTLDDNSAEFLSISQIDSVVDFYTNEKERLLSRSLKQQSTDYNQLASSSNHPSNSNQLSSRDFDVRQQQLNQQANSKATNAVDSSQLLDNPQIKAALNSLMNLGALNQPNENHQMTNSSNNDGLANTNNYVSSSMNSYSNFNLNDRQAPSLQLGDNYMNNHAFTRQLQQNQFYGAELNKLPDQQPMFRSTKNDFNQPPMHQQFRGPRQSRFN